LLEIYFAGIEIYGEERFMKMIQQLKNEIEGLKKKKGLYGEREKRPRYPMLN